MDTFRTIIAGWVIGFILLFFVAVKRSKKYVGRGTEHHDSSYCGEEDEDDPEEDPDILPASRIYITQEVPSVFDELRGKKK